MIWPKKSILPVFLFWLVVAGAVAIVIGVHLQWITSIPDPWCYPDTETYLGPALDFLDKHSFHVGSGRTPGYPLFLSALLFLFHSLSAVLVLQHLTLVATALLAAFVAYRAHRNSKYIAVLVFALVSLMPWSLVASHKLLTETLYTFVEVLLLVFLAEAWKVGGRRLWMAAGAATVGAAFVRPDGVVLFAAIPAVVLLYSRRYPRWRRGLFWWGITVAMLSCTWCAANLHYEGFWGFTSWGGQVLFSRTAYLLEPDRLQDRAIARFLQPYYNPKDDRLENPNWVQYNNHGPVKALRRAGFLQPNEDAALRHLGWSAIGSHPFRMAFDQVRRCSFFYWSMYAVPPGYMSPVLPTLDSIKDYMRIEQTYPQVKDLTLFTKTTPAKYLYRMDREPLYPLQPGHGIAWLCWPIRWFESSIPLILFLTFVLFAIKHRDPLFDLLAVIVLCHIFMATMDWELTVRHAVPLEPLFILLVIRALFYRSAWRDDPNEEAPFSRGVMAWIKGFR